MMKSVETSKFIEICREELKKIEQIKPPEWSRFAKSGVHRKYPPQQEDWWYTRAASMLRRIYLDGPVGVLRLRTYYGGRKERGHKPEKFRRAGGSGVRKILQQLEAAGFVEKGKTGKKGRVVSEKGEKFLKKIVSGVKK